MSSSEEIRALHADGVRGAGAVVGHLDTTIDVEHRVFRDAQAGGRLVTRAADYVGRRVGPVADGPGGLHGTHTAGLLIGRPCDGEAVGVAPDASLRSCAVIDEGNVVARTAVGLDWLIDQDVTVVVIPLGFSGPSPVFRSLLDELTNRDALVVVATGNRGAGRITVPATEPACLTVGSVDANGRVARRSGSWCDSGSGTTVPDICAPGVDRRSAMPGGRWATLSGTSSAAAMVAGAAALLRSARPDATADEVRSALIATADEPDDDQWSRCRRAEIHPVTALQWLRDGPSIPLQPSTPAPAAQPIPRGVVTPHVDDRLLLWLDTAGDRDIDVIIEFDDRAGALAVAESLTAGSDASTCGPIVLRHAPILLATLHPSLVAELLRLPSLAVATAADANRL